MIAFTARYILPDARSPWLENSAILVDNGRIVGVGKAETIKRKAETVVDLGKTAVIPGLIDAHAHVAMTLLRGLGNGLGLREWLEKAIWPIEAQLSEKDIYYGNVLGIAELLLSGVVAFADFYNVEPMLKVLENMPIRALLTLAVMDKVEYMSQESWKRVDNIKHYLDEVMSRGKGRVQLAIGPHAPYSCTPEILRRVSEESAKHNIRIHTHLAETAEEVKQLVRETGLSPVKYLESLGLVNERLIAAHCVHVTDEDIAILSARKANVVHCPRSNARLGVGIIRLRELLGSNVNVAIGTDGAASSDSLDMLEELRLAAYLQRASTLKPGVVSARDLLEMATVKGAKALGFEDLGSLTPGHKADFVVFSMESLRLVPAWDLLTNIIMAAGPQDIKAVYVSGKALVENGQVALKDLDRALERAEALREELTRS